MLTPTAHRPAFETWNAHPFHWGLVALGLNFAGTGSFPARMLTPFDSQLIALQLRRWKFIDRLLLLFRQNLSGKRQISVSQPHFGEVRGYARPWLMARWKAYSQLSIRRKWTFFAIYYGSWVMRQNMYCSAVFYRCRPLCTQILPGQGRFTSTILGIRKLHCEPEKRKNVFWYTVYKTWPIVTKFGRPIYMYCPE